MLEEGGGNAVYFLWVKLTNSLQTNHNNTFGGRQNPQSKSPSGHYEKKPVRLQKLYNTLLFAIYLDGYLETFLHHLENTGRRFAHPLAGAALQLKLKLRKLGVRLCWNSPSIHPCLGLKSQD